VAVIDDYLKSAEEPAGSALQTISEIVKQIEPTAEEAIVYGVAGFKYKGKFFIGFAAHENFLSLYPASLAIKVLENKLKKYDLSKGVIRFTVDNQISKPLLREIVQIRLDEMNGK
jgi:uncharacterized protein YdhG (YjbR/CyaY superfamily)